MRIFIAMCIALFGLHYFPNIWPAAKLSDTPERSIEVLFFACIGMYMFCHALLLALGIAPAALMVLTLFISIVEMWIEFILNINSGYTTSWHFGLQLVTTIMLALYVRPCFLKEYPSLSMPIHRRRFEL